MAPSVECWLIPLRSALQGELSELHTTLHPWVPLKCMLTSLSN